MSAVEWQPLRAAQSPAPGRHRREFADPHTEPLRTVRQLRGRHHRADGAGIALFSAPGAATSRLLRAVRPS